jgi:hypothetical protein
MNGDLVRAITEKHLIRFVYKAGGYRIVEPHDYGILQGVESLLAYQVAGESRSGTARGWKHFEVAHIRYLQVLERRFPGTRADSAQRHHIWDALFARVDGGHADDSRRSLDPHD